MPAYRSPGVCRCTRRNHWAAVSSDGRWLASSSPIPPAGVRATALELNANPERLDLSDLQAFRARELGIPIAIDTDAHRPEGLRHMRYGVDQARRAWLEPKDVLNARTLPALRRWLDRS